LKTELLIKKIKPKEPIKNRIVPYISTTGATLVVISSLMAMLSAAGDKTS
jgi:hypothetical protein